MSYTKTDGMAYESAGHKKSKGNSVAIEAAEMVSTPRLLWLLVKRHKVGILGTWAVVITALYIFPPLPDLVLSLFGH